MPNSPPEITEVERLETWGDIQDDPDAIIACGNRWKALANQINCHLHGFNDGRGASFFTPDGNVIEVGPKFRAAIEALQTKPEPPSEIEGLLKRLEDAGTYCGALSDVNHLFGEAAQTILSLQRRLESMLADFRCIGTEGDCDDNLTVADVRSEAWEAFAHHRAALNPKEGSRND